MRSVFLSCVALASAVAGCSSPKSTMRAEGAPSVNYTVSIPDPASESFQVKALLNGIQLDTMTFYFPIWGPGAYDVVNFGGYVHDFAAAAGDGAPLKVIRTDTNTFKVVGVGSGTTLSYRVHDIESTDNSAWFGLSDIEPTFAFANTPAIFGYPDGYKDIPYDVTYRVPSGWDIAVGLDPAGAADSYRARDYDELVDAPVQMGTFQKFTFDLDGKPYVITVTAPEKLSQSDAQGLVDSTRKIVRIITGFFGDIPYDRYVFQHYLVTQTPDDVLFGALEHRNSSTYRMPYAAGNVADELGPVIAHEFWHAWSPKRIHVRQLGPFDYQHPPRTKSLWFAEGLTEYYAQVLLLRNGMVAPEKLLSDIDQGAEMLGSRPQRESITSLSMKIAEVPPMQVLALYTKGPLLGFLLDADIRLQTDNKKSLDDAMRFFNEQYGKTGKTFGDDDIVPMMERATGTNLQDFYNRYIAGTDPLPFAEYLPKIGLTFVEYPDTVATFGGDLEQDAKGWKIVAVTPGSSFEAMGLRVGDVLTELHGPMDPVALAPIPAQVAETIAQQIPPGMGLSFGVERDGEKLEVPLTMKTKVVTAHRLDIDPDASGTALAIRRGMMGL